MDNVGIFVRCEAFYFLRRSTTSIFNNLVRRFSRAGGEQSLLFIKATRATCFLAHLQSEEVAVASLQLPQQGGQPRPPRNEWQTAPPHKMADSPTHTKWRTAHPPHTEKRREFPSPDKMADRRPLSHTHTKKKNVGQAPPPRPTQKKRKKKKGQTGAPSPTHKKKMADKRPAPRSHTRNGRQAPSLRTQKKGGKPPPHTKWRTGAPRPTRKKAGSP